MSPLHVHPLCGDLTRTEPLDMVAVTPTLIGSIPSSGPEYCVRGHILHRQSYFLSTHERNYLPNVGPPPNHLRIVYTCHPVIPM